MREVVLGASKRRRIHGRVRHVDARRAIQEPVRVCGYGDH